MKFIKIIGRAARSGTTTSVTKFDATNNIRVNTKKNLTELHKKN